jgi:hypothetical protein
MPLYFRDTDISEKFKWVGKKVIFFSTPDNRFISSVQKHRRDLSQNVDFFYKWAVF